MFLKIYFPKITSDDFTNILGFLNNSPNQETELLKNASATIINDLLVENEIIIETKSSDGIAPIFMAQVITYLKLYGKNLGYLINFNVPLLKEGFKRIVYKF